MAASDLAGRTSGREHYGANSIGNVLIKETKDDKIDTPVRLRASRCAELLGHRVSGVGGERARTSTTMRVHRSPTTGLRLCARADCDPLEARAGTGGTLSANIEISYSADIRGYELGASQSPRDTAQRDHAAATRMIDSLMEAAYELASELRGMGPTAHELHRDRHGLPLRERLTEVLQAVHDLQTDLASLRGTVLVRQLEALGIDEHSSNLKVHIGCGGQELPGWINVDNYPAPLAINLNWGLPLPDRSASYVFLSHLLEHLFYPVQSGQLLAEVKRVLAPGGIVRIVVPDIEQCIKAYVDQNEEFFAARRRHWTWLPTETTNLESFLAYAGAGPTPGDLFEHHKFGYDFDTLRRCLERAGFVSVRRCEYQRSPHEPLRVDHASSNASAKQGEQHYSLFVEAQA